MGYMQRTIITRLKRPGWGLNIEGTVYIDFTSPLRQIHPPRLYVVTMVITIRPIIRVWQITFAIRAARSDD